MNKKLLLTAVTVTVLGTGLFGMQAVSAQTSTDPSASIVQKISEKFGLNKDEVQKVFDAEHQARRAEMQAKMQKRLTTLVSEGKITEAQKQLIIAKQKELQAERGTNRQNMQNLTPEQRKTEMESKKAEMDAWAKENGIDTQYLFFGHGMKGFGRGHMGQPAN
jgi:predicted RND superfamily exporter protein